MLHKELGFISVVNFPFSKYCKGFDQRWVGFNYFFPLLVRRAENLVVAKVAISSDFNSTDQRCQCIRCVSDQAQTWYRVCWATISTVWRPWTWVLLAKHSPALDQSNVLQSRPAKIRHYRRQEVLLIWFGKCLLYTAHLCESFKSNKKIATHKQTQR